MGLFKINWDFYFPLYGMDQTCKSNKFISAYDFVSLKGKSSHLFTITEPGIKAVTAGQTLPFKLGLSSETSSVISSRDSVWF